MFLSISDFGGDFDKCDRLIIPAMSYLNESRGSTPRVIFIGDSGVGKTSIIHRIKTGSFLSTTTPTIGAGVTTVDAETERGTRTFQLWDTAGQEVYRNIIPIYFKGADAAVVVFSCSDAQSFEHLQSWLNELDANAEAEVITLIVGNKCDLEHVKTDVEVRKWCQTRKLPLVFVSAKTGQGMDVLMKEIVNQYMNKRVLKRETENVMLTAESGQTSCC